MDAAGLAAHAVAAVTDPAPEIVAGSTAMAAGQEPATQAATQGVANDSPLEQAVLAQEATAEPAAAQPEVVVPDPLPEPYTSLFKQAREAPTENNGVVVYVGGSEIMCKLYGGLIEKREIRGRVSGVRWRSVKEGSGVDMSRVRGLAYVGMDYLSHGLWDKYLTYELGLGAHAQVAQLYSRLLRMPIQRLDEYRTRFHEYAAGHSAAELVSEQERASIAMTKEEWYRRKPFEDAIKRPYFHVKPLDSAQLQNWSRYLDYIEEKKDIGMIIRLYERCLVACASYPDLWMRYVRWQEISSKAAAQVALERATSVHCKRRPEMQLFAAHFHERHGNADTARALFRLVTERLAPTLIPGAVQHANFERRQGSKAAACAVYDKFLEREAGKDSATYVFVVIQYINALQCGFQDTQKAREVYNAALEKAQDSIMLCSSLSVSRVLWIAQLTSDLVTFESLPRVLLVSAA
ncbi:hypothetical protein WJX79_009679 [Trebouxia sp. C0005]